MSLTSLVYIDCSCVQLPQWASEGLSYDVAGTGAGMRALKASSVTLSVAASLADCCANSDEWENASQHGRYNAGIQTQQNYNTCDSTGTGGNIKSDAKIHQFIRDIKMRTYSHISLRQRLQKLPLWKSHIWAQNSKLISFSAVRECRNFSYYIFFAS